MKYDTTIVDRILDLFGSGDHSIKEICKIVKISQMTFWRWREEKPEFAQSLKKMEEIRIKSLKDMSRTGLAKLLNGYEYDEVTKEITQVPFKLKDPETGKYEIQFDDKGNVVTKTYPASLKTVRKFIMPNPTAVLSTLKNLDPENFPDVSKLDHTTGGAPLNSSEELLVLTPEQIKQRRLEAQEKLNKLKNGQE